MHSTRKIDMLNRTTKSPGIFVVVVVLEEDLEVLIFYH